LMEKGANPNIRGNFGMTPLMIAVENHYPAIVSTLVNRGVDFNITDYKGKTALALAVDKGHEDIAIILRKAGAKQ